MTEQTRFIAIGGTIKRGDEKTLQKLMNKETNILDYIIRKKLEEAEPDKNFIDPSWESIKDNLQGIKKSNSVTLAKKGFWFFIIFSIVIFFVLTLVKDRSIIYTEKKDTQNNYSLENNRKVDDTVIYSLKGQKNAYSHYNEPKKKKKSSLITPKITDSIQQTNKELSNSHQYSPILINKDSMQGITPIPKKYIFW